MFQHDGPLLVTANVIPPGSTQAEIFWKDLLAIQLHKVRYKIGSLIGMLLLSG